MKKTLQACRSKPKHIHQDHCINLSKLISDDRKQKEAKILKYNRAQVKRPSVVDRCEDNFTTNMVSTKPMNFGESSCTSYSSIMQINKR